MTPESHCRPLWPDPGPLTTLSCPKPVGVPSPSQFKQTAIATKQIPLKTTMKIYNLFAFLSIASNASAVHLRSHAGIPSDAAEKLEDLASSVELAEGKKDRDLQIGFICNRIEDVFNGDVICNCGLDFRQGQVTFDCAFQKTVCAPETVAGVFCAKPTYNGALTIRPLRREFQLQNAVCVQDASLSGSPLGGNITFSDLCVDTDICFQNGQGLAICECTGSYGGTDCTCQPCTTPDGTNGVTLECGSVDTPVCIPLAFPGGASTASSVNGFVPMLTVPEE